LQGKAPWHSALFWSGLASSRELETVSKAAGGASSADAGIVLVDVDMPGLFEQNAKVSLFPFALHETIADISPYIKASENGRSTPSRLRTLPGKDRQPRTFQGCVGAITDDAFCADYQDAAPRCRRPAAAEYVGGRFPRTNNLGRPSCFDQGRGRAPLIPTPEKGFGRNIDHGGPPVRPFDTHDPTTRSRRTPAFPAVAIAGMTPVELPVGAGRSDGPVGSARNCVGLGCRSKAILRFENAPAAEDVAPTVIPGRDNGVAESAARWSRTGCGQSAKLLKHVWDSGFCRASHCKPVNDEVKMAARGLVNCVRTGLLIDHHWFRHRFAPGR